MISSLDDNRGSYIYIYMDYLILYTYNIYIYTKYVYMEYDWVKVLLMIADD